MKKNNDDTPERTNDGDVFLDTVTPISKEEIIPVDSSEWGNLTINQLFDQLTIMNERVYNVGAMGKPEMVNQLNRGIAAIYALIEEKQSHIERVIT